MILTFLRGLPRVDVATVGIDTVLSTGEAGDDEFGGESNLRFRVRTLRNSILLTEPTQSVVDVEIFSFLSGPAFFI